MSHRLERQMKITVKVVQYYLKVRLLYNYDGTRDASDSHLRQNVVENREQVFKSGFLHWILMINNNNVLYICAIAEFHHNAAHSELKNLNLCLAALLQVTVACWDTINKDKVP